MSNLKKKREHFRRKNIPLLFLFDLRYNQTKEGKTWSISGRMKDSDTLNLNLEPFGSHKGPSDGLEPWWVWECKIGV
jgi:hypothetical protein